MHPNFLNLVYTLLLLAISPWLLLQAIFKKKYRSGWHDKLVGGCRRINEKSRPRVWFHAVSVGEVNLLNPIISRMKDKLPGAELFISTTTRTGFELALQRFGSEHVFYCPLDFTWAVNRRLNILQPDILVLAELEIWPNLIRTCKSRSIPVAVVNGRLSEKSFRGYQRFSRLLKPVFESLDYVGVQNAAYASRFEQLGVDSSVLEITGSIKFDGATTDRRNSKTIALAELAQITPDDIVFVAGSTQEPEEQYALNIFTRLQVRYPRLKLLIVPRHPDRFDQVARLLDESKIQWQRRSELNFRQTLTQRVILVDTIGELAAWWGVADVAFVGGSFGSRGGQNMIEPAGYGAAVSFGPNTENFRDIAQLLLESDAAERVQTENELQEFVEQCLEDSTFRDHLGQRAQSVVCSQLGAADSTVERLIAFIERERDLKKRKVA